MDFTPFFNFWLLVFCLHVNSLCALRFVSDETKSYLIGYVWKHAKAVYITPKLQVQTDISENGVCDVKVRSVNNSITMNAKILNKVDGFIDLIIENDSLENSEDVSSLEYKLEAFSCELPTKSSGRITITIHVIVKEAPFFAQPSYTFTISQQSHVGSVVGKVQAIEQVRQDEDPMLSAICNYQLDTEKIPFTIDKYGVIRVKEKLEPRSKNQPYVFEVIVEDCHRPRPRTSSVDVMVKLIMEGCQTGWKGLPTFIEVRGTSDRPYNLLHPYKLTLDTCAGNCPETVIQTRVELVSAVHGHTLTIADAKSCFHDPHHLKQQRKLCDIHTHTLVNLLPSPDQDIASQLSGSQLGGNPPRLTAPVQTWDFAAQRRSVWEVNPDILDTPKHGNAFDSEFSLTFWLRRSYSGSLSEEVTENQEETVLCSHDVLELSWRFVSVSFRGCQLIVRLMASLRENESELSDDEVRDATKWEFGVLPEDICSTLGTNTNTWHHYAITFSRNPWGATTEFVSIIVDGKDLGAIGIAEKTARPTNPPFNPLTDRAKPKITVGACYSPTTHLTRQHLNGKLAGLTLLIGRTEAPNNLRCIALCGETLLVPNVLNYLRPDVGVDLENNAVTITGNSRAHVSSILGAIAYVRSQSPPGVNTVPPTQSRLLNITTLYICGKSERIVLPDSKIELNVLPPIESNSHIIETGHPDSDSAWVTENEQLNTEEEAIIGTPSKPPLLLIEGSDIIITEPPIVKPGIQLFADVHFEFPDEGANAHETAAAVPLDGCLISVTSSGEPRNLTTTPSLREIEDEHIDWSVDKLISLGLSNNNEKQGISLNGRRPAGDYENLLKSFYYWPPKSMRGTESVETHRIIEQMMEDNAVKYMATFQLICTIDSGKQTTSQFLVKVIIEGADQADEDLKNNETLQRLSPNSIETSYDKSDQDRRQLGAPGLLKSNGQIPIPGQSKQSDSLSTKSPLTALGIAASAFLVMVLASTGVALHVRRSSRLQPQSPSLPPRRGTHGRGRFARRPAAFGGENLKRDPTLRLTANPFGEMELQGLGTIHEDLSGSVSDLAPRKYIFSPPVNHRLNSNSNARLAGLDEFDDQIDEDDSFSDGYTSTLHHEPPPTFSDYSPQPLEHESHIIDVHRNQLDASWMDEDLNDSNYALRPQKWDLVAHCPVIDEAPIDTV